MNALEQLALGSQCLARGWREAGRRELWLAWLPVLAARIGVLALLVWCAHPLVSWLLAPMLRAAEGDGVLRYPELFRRLPPLAGRADLFVAAVLAPLSAGVATLTLAPVFRGQACSPGAAWREALPRWPALVIANLPATAAMIGLQFALTALPGARVSGMTRMLAPYAAWVVEMLAQTAFFYASALVVLEHRSAWSAVAAIPGTLGRGFLPALFVTATLWLFLAPLQWLGGQRELIVARGLPELVALVVLLRAGLATGLGLIASGAATLAYLGALAGREDGT